MSQDARLTLNTWLQQLTGGAGLDANNVAVVASSSSSLPLYVLHPGAAGDIFILAVEIDRLAPDCPRELLANLLALNNRPALTAGAFGINSEDGTLTYRYFGEMAGMDFPYFRNTVANFGALAEQALAAYRNLASANSSAPRNPLLASQRVVA
ncbi:hypothetical protein ACFWP0_13390 [Achromobacter sp. NPDC058515]|uniref:hypothetical protein n=1 Tax=Achromobacter sp. NPDC058515 TaxID=3346533 RepID=UPI0036608FDA